MALVRKKGARCTTTYKEDILDTDTSLMSYEYLINKRWVDGIRSKSGFTRKACSLTPGDDTLVDNIVETALVALAKNKYATVGIYLNYYENGKMWTPNHTHPETHQLVVSLGAERVLQVAKKTYKMKTGSAIIFGSASHGVPKCECQEGRISIAVFLVPIV